MKPLSYWARSAAASVSLAFAPVMVASAQSPAGVIEADTRASAEAYEMMLSEAFTDLSDPVSDLSVVTEALPAGVALSWDTVAADAATGANVYDNLEMSFTGPNGTFGLRFDEAKIWGLDEAYLTARLSGARLDEPGIVATRIDATGLQVFGVSEYVTDLIASFMPDDEAFEDLDIGLPQFDVTTERVLIQNLRLNPFVYKPLSADRAEAWDMDAEALPFIHAAQAFAAASASIGYDLSISRGNKGSIRAIVPGEDTLFEFSQDLVGSTNVMGFDVENSVSVGYDLLMRTRYTESLEEPSIANVVGDFAIDQSETSELSVIRGMKLNPLLNMLATGDVPKMSATDLLSIGTFANFNGSSALNGDELFTYDALLVDLSSFTWFVPNRIAFDVQGGQYDIEGIGRFAEMLLDKAEPILLEDDAELYVQMVEGLENTMTLLPETGLDKLPFNFSGAIDWNAETGATNISYDWAAPGFGDESFNLVGSLPKWSQWQSLEGLDEDQIEDRVAIMLASNASVTGMTWEQTDKGGYDRLMRFAIGMANYYPEEDWSAMVAEMEPATMRALAGLGLRMAKAELPEDVPQLGPWIDTLASYIQVSGGTLRLEIKPEDPITAISVAMYSEIDDPGFILEQLGITLTHTPDSSE